MFELGAILPFSVFLASREINNSSVFNTRKYSDILFRSGSVWRRVHLAIFFSLNCLRHACALAISRAGHWAFGCDLLLRGDMARQGGSFSQEGGRSGGPEPGGSGLGVGCGTGTPANSAQPRFGPEGRGGGGDASP